MKTIKMYSASAQSNAGGAAKGTVSNPYTEEEFNSMADAGTWKGGYVEGLGYVGLEVKVKGSSGSDSDSWSDPWEFSSDPWGITSNPWWNTGDDSSSGGGGAGNNNGGNQDGGHSSGNGGTNSPYPQTVKTISGTAILYKGVEGLGLQSTFPYGCTVKISGNTMYIGVEICSGNFTGKEFWATAVVKSNGGKETYHKLSYYEKGYIHQTGWSVIGDVSFELPKSGDVTVDVRIGYNYDTGAGHTGDSTNIHIYPF